MTHVCQTELVGLLLLFLALLMSMCLNLFFCIRRRAYFCRDKGNCCYPQKYEGGGLSPDEGHYFHDLNHHEQQENPHNDHEQQENPIYGNISTDRRGSGRVEVCYEMMTMHRLKPLEPDLNYASLDLKLAKKRKKKHRHQQDQTQSRSNRKDQLPVQLTPPGNSFLEVEGDVDAHLPSRDTSTMVSHSSIYLNSQQIAQETEEMERERGINMEREIMGWEGVKMREDEGIREWKGEKEGEEGKDRQGVGNGTVCAQLSELQATQNDTDQ
ncbi:uncharacterized protein LOC111651619 [Seriola lalandi dorsalis]|uniref:uncharacterized protein LOC111651619 n=1 Tax=Seriola lalandi dorsalis TaxID=1841481 RepID=UPI000C6F6887|nr:uncharacterized protein LOC111651619 [Seriola lalandi dorsalis]XP_056253151.1 uncharacterized protein LOC130182333 [Seriola aureovittata]